MKRSMESKAAERKMRKAAKKNEAVEARKRSRRRRRRGEKEEVHADWRKINRMQVMITHPAVLMRLMIITEKNKHTQERKNILHLLKRMRLT